MSGVSAKEETVIKFFLGSWLIGGCIDLVLMGVLCCQFVNYFRWYPQDSRRLQLAVAILCLLNLLKSGACFASLWIFLINHFGDINYDLELSATGWWDTANPLMVLDFDFSRIHSHPFNLRPTQVAILDFYVQCYFCTRLWGVSKSWVVAPIFFFFICGLVSMGIGTYYIKILQHPRVANWFAVHLGCVFAGDVILSTTTAYFLIRTKKTVFSNRTAELVGALISLTFQTAAPPAIIAMLNLIFSQLYHTNQPLLGYVEIGFNQVLPKLYAISMMYTLNARRVLRSKLLGSHNGSSTNEPSFTGRGKSRHGNGDVELDRIGLSTRRETRQQVNVTGMFASTHSIQDSKLALGPD
ncbi:hypothetical protein MSAN_00285200 [Mycena sanguinolenta]|uniref:DUF6534 domain-containing protein n=1 Tax=Mycena sanguinolenta TaxID=230812 RepID=A0A8H6ZEA0_9AGAR|nr:hypothetical protein MSAN_00285200 [Mycena sanguinolenta]